MGGDYAADHGGGGVHVAADDGAGADGGLVVVEAGGGGPEGERDGVLCGDPVAVAEFVGRFLRGLREEAEGALQAAADVLARRRPVECGFDQVAGGDGGAGTGARVAAATAIATAPAMPRGGRG
ncbi:hypothetical protein BJF79_33245 [Actinomadura sp. CNU-125]|nr:hypothetical protein BJF79_33245 [Actinomadura sp. CNU-125]